MKAKGNVFCIDEQGKEAFVFSKKTGLAPDEISWTPLDKLSPEQIKKYHLELSAPKQNTAHLKSSDSKEDSPLREGSFKPDNHKEQHAPGTSANQ